MSSRKVIQVFEQYQKDRQTFVQSVADLASRPENIETLQNADAMALLRPLLLDVVPAIQQTAALALGRLANYNEDLAEAVVKGDILPQLVYSLAEQNRFYKKAAAFVLRAVAKHSPQLAQAVVDCGALDALVICLEEFDPGVKEAAAWALGYIARHNAVLSQAVVDAGAVPLLVLCIQEPELPLKRIAASALSDICKHSPELAQTVVDAGAIAHLAQMILNGDCKLKRHIFSALSQIAKHSVDLAEMVVEAEIFPAVLGSLKDSDEYVKKNVATLIREIAKHTPELALLITNAGGVGAVVDYIRQSKGNVRLPGIMMLGYVAAHSESLAMSVIVSQAVTALAAILAGSGEDRTTELGGNEEDHIKAAIAWALGQIGRHTPEHAKAVAVTNALNSLLQCYLNTESSEDLQTKVVCDDNMVFRDILVGWPGSVHDSRVLRNSSLQATAVHKFPGDTHLLGDGGYPLKRWLITPFRDNGHLTARQRRFNYKLSILRSIVERSIQLLKGRWRKLLSLEHMDMELLVHLIMSACVLHNFCLLNDDFDEGYFLDCGDGADDDDGGIDGGPHAGPLPTAEAKRVQLMNIVC